MISRSGSQRTAAAPNRPYSSNNPFRTAASDASVAQYSSDRQFQDWVKANGVQSPYAHGSRANSSSSIAESSEEHAEAPLSSPRPVVSVPDKYVPVCTGQRPFYGPRKHTSGYQGTN